MPKLNPVSVGSFARKPLGWAERHGGWIVSSCLHVCVLSLLLAGVTRPAQEPIRHIRLQFRPTPTPAPLPVRLTIPPARPPAVSLLPARANQPFPAPDASPAPPPKDMAMAMAAAQPPSPAPPRPSPAADNKPQDDNAPASGEGQTPRNAGEIDDPAQRMRVRQILDRYRTDARTGRDGLAQGRKNLAARLEQAGLQVSAYPHFPEFAGARVGAIRTLTFDNVKPAVTREVMTRYEIRITQRFVSQSGPSYLNSAASGGSVYRPTDKPGYYEVFEISPKAYRRMVVLEQNWLVAHGYDPRTARVDVVEFGIVPISPNFWDLDILRMAVQRVSEIGKPSLDPAPTPAAPPPNP